MLDDVTAMRVLRRARLGDSAKLYSIELRDGKIMRLGAELGARIGAGELDLDGSLVVPGFVDLHNHGAAGSDFADPDAAAFHLSQGTTTLLASIMSAGHEELVCSVEAAAAAATANPAIAGLHIEGPYLSHDRRGAHDPAALRTPNLKEVQELWDASRGTIRQWTIAPEVDEGDVVLRFCLDHAIIPAFGHTSVGYDDAASAFERGYRHVTHTLNAMEQIDRRNPGPVPAALQHPGVTLEVVADGHHLHPSVVAMLVHAAGHDRIAAITDSSVLAGLPDGDYDNGGHQLTARGSLVYNRGTDTIAGSRATMLDCFRTLIQRCGLTVDDAVALTSTNPARILGLDKSKGRIAPGWDADLVIVDDQLQLQGVVTAQNVGG